MNQVARDLLDRIQRCEAQVGVIGLGYVGLPLSRAFLKGGFRVLGFDVDATKTAQLNRGVSYMARFSDRELGEAVQSNRFSACDDFHRLDEPDVLLICVPTPLTPERDPDLTFVIRTAQKIRNRLRPGQLVILESTTYPGTTEEVLLSELAKGSLACGEDYFLAYSPERQDPGNPDYDTSTIPKLVSGIDAAATDLAAALYGMVIDEVVRLSTPRAAEATKLLENIFRSVNIALVNELKIVYEEMGIDIWEVLEAADSKPFGFMRFNPGPGWGGHCIPVDPFYLAWKARQLGIATRFIELAGEVNVRMPQYVVHKLQNALNRNGKPVKGSKILILGLAYKRDVADTRESPAFEVMSHLLELEADLSYHDPLVPEVPPTRSWMRLAGRRSSDLTQELLEELDAVVLVTDHSAVDYELVLRNAELIVDTRGALRGRGPNVVPA